MIKTLIAMTAIGAGVAYAEPLIETYRPDSHSGESDVTITTQAGKFPARSRNFGIEDVKAARAEGILLGKYSADEALHLAIEKAKSLYPGDVFFEKCFLQECKVGFLKTHSIAP